MLKNDIENQTYVARPGVAQCLLNVRFTCKNMYFLRDKVICEPALQVLFNKYILNPFEGIYIYQDVHLSLSPTIGIVFHVYHVSQPPDARGQVLRCSRLCMKQCKFPHCTV